MTQQALTTLLEPLHGILEMKGERVVVHEAWRLPAFMDHLAYQAAFGDEDTRAAARWLIWETAQALGIRPASIHELYMARGRGDCQCSFTVPAMNLRMLAYDSARAVFRAARKLDAGAFIFEIARSEMGYTDQRPAEYTTSILAAALREGYHGPVFIQGDHFQVSAKRYASGAGGELQAIRDLIDEAIAAGFYNIDIDTSTLVDLSRPTHYEQQKLNYELCAEFTRYIRQRQPQGVIISVGGEIGEVGAKNSDEHDLRGFMQGYLEKMGDLTGISKISIQTGTSHGGVVLPDGTLADVAIDFDTLRQLSALARAEYGMGGAVQHGASTLPESAFSKFVEAGACEVHLATAFQTMIMDHPSVPAALREEMKAWLFVHAADERKPQDTDEQFIYKARKKAIGPFKRMFWNLPAGAREAIGAALEERFEFLFRQLAIGNSVDLVRQFVTPPEIHQPLPAGGALVAAMEQVEGLAD